MKKLLIALMFSSFAAYAQQPQWVTTSNTYAKEVLQVIAEQNPENGSNLGIESVDSKTQDLRLSAEQQGLKALDKEIDELQSARSKEQDPRVLQDLAIMTHTLQQMVHSQQLHEQYEWPFYDVGKDIYQGLYSLLDERNAPARQAKALVRLKSYIGEKTLPALVEQAKQRTTQALGQQDLTAPYVKDVEQVIANTDQYLAGIKQLLTQRQLSGWQDDFQTLTTQLTAYKQWLKTTVLPKARQSNVMPKVLYVDALKNAGVELTPEQLISRALFEAAEIRDEMTLLAKRIAKKRGFKQDDYPYVIRQLRKEQLTGKEVLPFFKKRLATIEQIVREHHIVTLPKRAANIRIASAAETAAMPAAHMNPPRLIGNTGEYGEFVIPLINKDNENDPHRVTDFTSKAFSWTLTVHEARPGHELQFSAMLEQGVSLARAIFAMNSANVEGWALYAEAIMKQYLPKEGQLFSLQARLQRAARAYLDPMLNLGMMTPEEAEDVLVNQVALSQPFAQQEVERYTVRMPGQATSYFYGYMMLRQLRMEAEIKLGDAFNQQDFHDFILSQGLLPPTLLKKAVEETYIPQHQA